MRNWLFVLVVLASGLVGYALTGSRVAAQTERMPFSIGDVVSLHMEDGRRTLRCAVGSQRGDFLSCRADENRPETWYNLRFVAEVRRVTE